MRRTCQRCGVLLALEDRKFCQTCGPLLSRELIGSVFADDEDQTRDLARKTLRAQPVGTCLVCDLEMSQADVLAGCPHCGNIFHRDHIVSWVHMKRHCPVCGERLAEHEIITVSNEKPIEGDS